MPFQYISQREMDSGIDRSEISRQRAHTHTHTHTHTHCHRFRNKIGIAKKHDIFFDHFWWPSFCDIFTIMGMGDINGRIKTVIYVPILFTSYYTAEPGLRRN